MIRRTRGDVHRSAEEAFPLRRSSALHPFAHFLERDYNPHTEDSSSFLAWNRVIRVVEMAELTTEQLRALEQIRQRLLSLNAALGALRTDLATSLPSW